MFLYKLGHCSYTTIIRKIIIIENSRSDLTFKTLPSMVPKEPLNYGVSRTGYNHKIIYKNYLFFIYLLTLSTCIHTYIFICVYINIYNMMTHI